MKLRQECPNCGNAVPFKKTQMHLGKPFECSACSSKIVIERNYWIPILAFLAFFRFKGEVSGLVEGAALMLGIVAVIYLLSVIFMQPKLVKQ